VTISDSTVAIIGTGTIGSTLGANFATGGQDFLLAGRDQEAARKLASGLGGHAEVVSIDEAVERADVLVFALWLDVFKQLITKYGGRLAGKVIVDPTNPVGPDDAGGYRKVIGEQESSGQILAGLLPPGARLSRRSARCRLRRCRRPRGGIPSVRCSSTPRTTQRQATWSLT
jgi:predicted dinucleotide-binding enzyme